MKIYLDNNATTRLDPKVLQAMLQDLEGPPTNPSSIHSFGQRGRTLLLEARKSVASFFHAKPEEITFTSGGTESLHLMIQSLDPKGHIITTSLEHSSLLEPLKSRPVTYLPVGPYGAPTPEQIEAAIRPDTQALLLSAANGETGVKIDLKAIAALAQKRNLFLCLDAIAYIGKEPWIPYPGITAVALSGHKFHGPKGIGALYFKGKPSPLFLGGGQEGGRRAGTENLSGILGLAKALELIDPTAIEKIRNLRDRFETKLFDHIPDLKINGEGPRVSNVSNLSFPHVDGETLLLQLDLAHIAASHGSACSAGALEPSRVLTQMGYDRKRARASLRFSFSRMNTEEEVDCAVETLLNLFKPQR